MLIFFIYLQKDFIDQSELQKNLKTTIRETVLSYISIIDPNVKTDSVSETDIRKKFDEICSDKQKDTLDKSRQLHDILDALNKCIEDIDDTAKHQTQEQTSSKVYLSYQL